MTRTGTPSRSLAFPAALGACAAFVFFFARPADSGPGAPPRRGAMSQDVVLDGRLLGVVGGGWLISVTASNSGPDERHCNVSASVVSESPGDRMARVIRAPTVVYETTLVLAVPGKGKGEATVPIPADAAKRMPRPVLQRQASESEPAFRVQLRARCSQEGQERVS